MSSYEPEDPRMTTLRVLICQTASEALRDSSEVRSLVTELRRSGIQVAIKLSGSVAWTEVDWSAAERTARQRRWCPNCSTPEEPLHLRGRLVRERVASPDDHEVVEAPQVRWTCSLCGYGEVEPVTPAEGEGDGPRIGM
jgi:hypothetical protein